MLLLLDYLVWVLCWYWLLVLWFCAIGGCWWLFLGCALCLEFGLILGGLAKLSAGFVLLIADCWRKVDLLRVLGLCGVLLGLFCWFVFVVFAGCVVLGCLL